MNEFDAELAEVVMTPAEYAWHKWAMSCDVDTGGLCSCGHEGLGVDWHMSGCRGVEHALRREHPPRPTP